MLRKRFAPASKERSTHFVMTHALAVVSNLLALTTTIAFELANGESSTEFGTRSSRSKLFGSRIAAMRIDDAY